MSETVELTAGDGFAFPAYMARPVGYCWGGLLTWRSACLLRGLAAAAPYYGGGMALGVEPARQALRPEQVESFNAAAAALARQRTLAFFMRHLA